MEMFEACEAFSSLSQETRLKVFKLLIEYGQDGASPGSMAIELKIPDNTLSFHLSHLTRAKLISSKRKGRSVIYYADTNAMNDLIAFIRENCCGRESGSKRGRKRKC